jgi:putative membrane protein
MNTHPLLSPAVKTVSAKLAVVLLVAVLPATMLAQATVRDERVRDNRVAPAARDVRVVDPGLPLKKSDRDFMEKAAKASMSEVAISRVAASRTSNPEVRRFAQMMIDDHEGAIEQLTALATAHNLSLPAKDPRPEKWEKRDAKNFDREYLDQMVDDHEKVVNLFEKQAKDGVDADTVSFARKNLPKMQKHLQQALDLKRALTDKRAR